MTAKGKKKATPVIVSKTGYPPAASKKEQAAFMAEIMTTELKPEFENLKPGEALNRWLD